VLELARLVGYALRPGVAATTYLAYGVEDKFIGVAEIPVGAKSQSLPGPGELPQVFETAEKLEAKAKWNRLKLRMSKPQQIIANSLAGGSVEIVYFAGTTTGLNPNDLLLFDFGYAQVTRFVRAVEPLPDATQPELSRTRVTLQSVAPRVRAMREVADAEGDIRERFDDLLSEVAAILEAHSDLAAFKVDVKREMAGRVLGQIKTLSAQLQASTDLTEINRLLQGGALPRLREERAMAEQSNYTRLHTWLDSLVTNLERLVETTIQREAGHGELATPGSSPARRNGSARNGSELPLFEANIATLLTGLERPTSVPPATALQQQRDLAATFAVEDGTANGGEASARSLNGRMVAARVVSADASLKTIGTFRPAFREPLSAAVSNAASSATATASLQVYVFRAKAAPYGSTAPKRARYDERKNLVGYSEWELTGTTYDSPESFMLEYSYAANEGYGQRVEFSVPMQDGKRASFSGAVPDDGEFSQSSADGRIKLTVSKPLSDGSRRIRITGQFERDLILWRADSNRRVVVSYTIGSDTRKLDLGDKERRYLSFAQNARQHVLVNAIYDRADSATVRLTERLTSATVLPLDAPYDRIVPETWVAVFRPNERQPRIAQVIAAENTAIADFNLAAKVAQLTLSAPWRTGNETMLSDIRGVTVFAQSEALALAEEPIGDPIGKGSGQDEVVLDDLYDGLEEGRWAIVAGERTVQDVGLPGVKAAELVMLAGVAHRVIENLPGDTTHTYVRFDKPLEYQYKRETVVIYGNVVKATHGDTRSETLGAGDGSKALQAFTLRQPPLTHVPSPTPAGAESTLKVYVNDVQWHEADALAGLGLRDRTFITKTDDDGKSTVVFGNGAQGARLPTGLDNVKAAYRNGIGAPGNVKAEQISLLVTRPLGAKDVINPLLASGGADRETRDQARTNAPLAVMALDRLVSVQDYQDFTRVFAGIGKASAARLPFAGAEYVHVTIAGAGDIPIERTSDLYRNLVRALRQYGDPHQPIRVDARELALLVISAKVRTLPDYLWEPVAIKIRAALYEAFSFEKRELGQDALLSEAIVAIQSVEGVQYVDVDVCDAIPEKVHDKTLAARRLITPKEITEAVKKMAQPSADNQQPKPRVKAKLAHEDKGVIAPAGLTFLSPAVPDTLIINRI